MLRNIHAPETAADTGVRIRDAAFPAPFPSQMEYNAPVRGPWNIVNTSMLLPESHQIYICAEGCLRGVVMTAAEMNALDRMSWVAVREQELIDGGMDDQIVEGVTDILHKMDVLPRAVWIYPSCIHLFAGCDLPRLTDVLRERFPAVTFIEAWMQPTMRKTGLAVEEITWRQMYAPLPPGQQRDRAVNFIGRNFPTDESSELYAMLSAGGIRVRDVTRCRTYAEYLELSRSAANLSLLPVAKAAGAALERRLGQKYLYLPLCYGADEILENYSRLAELMKIPLPDFSQAQDRAANALHRTRELVGETPIELDYTAVPRPLGLARLLTEHGFRVRTVYADGFLEEERGDFEWLRRNTPALRICPTVDVRMRFRRPAGEKVLAIGQKAAFFSGTEYFVNLVAGGGMYGFDGIARLADLMTDAFNREKDTRTLISRKGLGCESCL